MQVVMKIILLVCILLCGCVAQKKILAIYPYVVIDKKYIYTDRNRTSEYTFKDVSGNRFMFYDYSNLWEIGDTINDPGH